MYWFYGLIGVLLVVAAVSDFVARRRGHRLRSSRESWEAVHAARRDTRRRMLGRMFPGLMPQDPGGSPKRDSHPPRE